MYMESVSTIRKTKLFNTKQSEQSYTKQEELEDHKGARLAILVNYPITKT